MTHIERNEGNEEARAEEQVWPMIEGSSRVANMRVAGTRTKGKKAGNDDVKEKR